MRIWCINCGAEFNTWRSKLSVGKGKYCSRKCADDGKRKFGTVARENNPAWSGNSVSYNGIHRYIRRHFDKTGRCKLCGDSTNFVDGRSGTCWALRRGNNYSRNKDDYLELCVKCHSLYDREKHPMYRREEVAVVDL